VVIFQRTMRLLRTIATLTFAGAALWPAGASAQEINFDQINKFESLGTGTLHVGAPPKAIIDDSERHVVILTIWDADAETKVYWRSPDGNQVCLNLYFQSPTLLCSHKETANFFGLKDFWLSLASDNHSTLFSLRTTWPSRRSTVFESI